MEAIVHRRSRAGFVCRFLIAEPLCYGIVTLLDSLAVVIGRKDWRPFLWRGAKGSPKDSTLYTVVAMAGSERSVDGISDWTLLGNIRMPLVSTVAETDALTYSYLNKGFTDGSQV